jgi:hypothetical protein
MMGLQYGTEKAVEAAEHAEYVWNKDPNVDHFAELYTRK